MCPQVVVTFSDFEKMERVCSVLLEKLDKSVNVGTPQYYHSAECLSQVRYTNISASLYLSRRLLTLMKCSNFNLCVLICALGGVHVCQQLKTLSRRPAKSVSSWGKLWDTLYWSERRRQGSGRMKMRRMGAEARALHPYLTFPVHPQSPPPHGCLCPSASETEAGKNSEDICH